MVFPENSQWGYKESPFELILSNQKSPEGGFFLRNGTKRHPFQSDDHSEKDPHLLLGSPYLNWLSPEREVKSDFRGSKISSSLGTAPKIRLSVPLISWSSFYITVPSSFLQPEYYNPLDLKEKKSPALGCSCDVPHD